MSELSALAGSERYGACDDEAQRSGSGPKSEEIPCPAQFSPRGGNGAVKGISELEQVMGVEPTSSAWEADVLPMNYTCVSCRLRIL